MRERDLSQTPDFLQVQSKLLSLKFKKSHIRERKIAMVAIYQIIWQSFLDLKTVKKVFEDKLKHFLP